MHGASTHLATEHRVLRLSNFPFHHELGGAVGHGLDPAFRFGEIVAATSDTDAHGMEVCGLRGHKSERSCSHGGWTKQLPEHCSSLFLFCNPASLPDRPNNAGCVQSTRAIGMNFSRLRAIQM